MDVAALPLRSIDGLGLAAFHPPVSGKHFAYRHLVVAGAMNPAAAAWKTRISIEITARFW
jgi:hypothetical protein